MARTDATGAFQRGRNRELVEYQGTARLDKRTKHLVQRLGPHVEDVEPVIVKPGERVDETDLLARLVGLGYRREYQVEHRVEVAVGTD